MGVLAAYFVGIHCLMAVVPAYFIPILPLLVVSSAAWAARVLTEGRPEAEPWAGRLAATLMGVVFVPCLAFSGYGVRRMQVYSREGSRDPSVAEANLLRESAVFPEDGWLLVESAKVRLRAGDRRAAVEALSKAVRLRPADRRARSLLGWALMLEGEPGLLLALEPEDRPVPPEIEVLKALVLIERGETSRARGMWEAARARWMQDSGLWREGTPEESQAARRLLAAQEASFPGFAVSVAFRYRSPRQREGAASALDRLARGDAAIAAAVVEKGLEEGDARLVRSRLSRLGRLTPEGRASLHRLALALQSRTGDYRLALAVLERLAREGDPSAPLLTDKGVALFQLGRRKEAEREMREALRLAPGFLPAAVSLEAILKAPRSPRAGSGPGPAPPAPASPGG